MVVRGIAWVALVVVAAGCSLDRHVLTSSGTGSHDGGPIVPGMDGGPILGDDAMIIEGDGGGGGCATPCTEGRVCEGGSCVCPPGACCPACVGGFSCMAGTCTMAPCGGVGEPCCGGGLCDPGARCGGASTCEACGSAGLPCCAGACSDGSTCSGGTCTMMSACGGAGEPCCGGTCDPGYSCEDPILGEPRCEECGGDGQPCCGGTCDSMTLNCDDITGNCGACGGWLAECCPGNVCTSGTCQSWGRCM